MKIQIVGSEGSGKTVLIAVMNNLIEKGYIRGIKFRAKDFKTKSYLHNILDILNKKEWPQSTKQGVPEILNWEWEIDNKINVNVSMHDIAGQDYREEICNPELLYTEPKKLPEKFVDTFVDIIKQPNLFMDRIKKWIKKWIKSENDNNSLLDRIKNSDIIIAICDISGYLGRPDDVNIRVGDVWITEWLLNNITPKQKLIIVLSKFDLYENELPVEKWQDKKELVKLLKNYMPQLNLEGYNLDNYSINAVSAVSVEAELTEEGKLIRIPKVPLQSKGIENLINEIIEKIHNCDVKSSETIKRKVWKKR